MRRRVAIVGAGITLFRRRMLESPKELSFEASKMALDSAGLTLKDIQSVVSGSAPDAFDGVHMKGEYYLDGMGAIGKPHERVYVGGGTGVFTPIGGWWNVASGLYDTCLCVAEEKMSPLHPHPQYAFWSIFDQILERPLGTTLLWIFSLEMRRYMHKYGITEEEIASVAVKNKGNAIDHPCAQLGAEITVDDVMNSEPICWPVKRLDVSPPSDGAAAVVLASEKVAKKLTDQPVWLDGVTQRDGDLPVCPSGGLLGVGNPIAAAGMMKICEVFWQLRGEAGKRQVKKDARTGLAQAWGDLMQVGTVAVMRS